MKSLVVASFVVLAAAGASAQEAFRFPADRFQPALDEEGLGAVEWAGVAPHLAVDAALFAGFEDEPLVVEQGGVRKVLVGTRLRADALASIALFEWVQLGVQVPVSIAQGRDEGRAAVVGDGHALRGFGPGDVRLRAKARVLSQRHGGLFDLALVPEVTLPSAVLPDWMGEPGISFSPQVAASKRFGGLKLAANAGLVLRAPVDDPLLPTHHELVLEGAAGWVFDVVPTNPTEVSLAFVTAASIASTRPPQSSQILLEVEHRLFGPFDLVLGGGGGLGGRGAPDFRLYAGARFAAGRGGWPW
jgi:hypothetical protein